MFFEYPSRPYLANAGQGFGNFHEIHERAHLRIVRNRL